MAHRTIILKGDLAATREEALANETLIYPGHALELSALGKVIRNNTQGTPTHGLMVALENELYGKDVADAYTNGEQLSFARLRAGDIFVGRVKEAEDLDVGDEVTVDNDGYFVEAASGETVCCIALEDSGGSLSADTLVKMMVVGTTFTSDGE